MVEVKFTASDRSLSERDISNVLDIVTSQKATGYFLFTNGRLAVNLERTLNGLNENSGIDVLIWKTSNIELEILKSPLIFRKYFPSSYQKFIKESRLFFIMQSKLCKSPLTFILASLRLIEGLLNLDEPRANQYIRRNIAELCEVVRSLVDEMDNFHRLIGPQYDE